MALTILNFASAILMLTASSVASASMSNSMNIAAPSKAEEPALLSRANDIPSSLWPQYLTTNEEVPVPGAPPLRKGTRGVLQRVQNGTLIVDFGRWGVQRIDPLRTNFFEEVLKLMKGESHKEFPNLTTQIGNKLMHFGEDNQPQRILMVNAKEARYFLILYLGNYDEQTASHVYKFGRHYEELMELMPEHMIVVMPRDRDYYDFGYTVGLPTPFIFPHMRMGYINSLSHTSLQELPYLVLADAEGKLLYQSDKAFEWSNFSSEIEAAYAAIGVNVSEVYKTKTRTRTRSASWLSN